MFRPCTVTISRPLASARARVYAAELVCALAFSRSQSTMAWSVRGGVCTSRRGGGASDGKALPNCQEWCASQTFLTGQSLQGQSPHSMLCLLRRAASVRTHAYARVRVCVCVRACVGLHEPHHAGAATPHIDTPKKYKKPKSGSVGVCGHVCACARACVGLGSISNKTLSGPLEAFSQDCGWPIHHMCCDPLLVMVLNTT